MANSAMPGERGTEGTDVDSIQTLVVVPEGGEWRIAAFQNTRVRPMGQSGGATVLWSFMDWLWRVFGPKNRETA